jgi:hypothetical protein
VVLKVRDWWWGGLGGWGGWILKRCLKVWSLQGGLDLKGGVDFSILSGSEPCENKVCENKKYVNVPWENKGM